MNPDNPTTEEQEDIDLGRVPPDLGCNNPTTGDLKVWLDGVDGDYLSGAAKRKILEIHNAALAAEREKHEKMLSEMVEQVRISTTDLLQERDKLRSQLAELEQQNKTFRAAQKACEDCDGPTMAEVQQMRKQLAAAVEALEHLSDACEPTDSIEWTGLIFCSHVKEICDAALDKIGGKAMNPDNPTTTEQDENPDKRRSLEQYIVSHNSPTTGEWTVLLIDEWIRLNPTTWRSVIAFAHNAALAAAVEALDRVSRACKEELSLPYYKATNTPAVMGTFVALQQIADAALDRIGGKL